MPLEVVAEPNGATVDIVFVHGLALVGEIPWTSSPETGSICWVKSILPTYMPQARIILFNYPAACNKFWAHISENEIEKYATNLLDGLSNIRQASLDRPVILVGHNLGGVVCQQAIVRIRRGTTFRNDKLFGHVCLLGTPFHDKPEPWAKERKKFTNLPNFDMDDLPSRDLSSNFCLFITNDKFRFMSKYEPRLEVACFFEGFPTHYKGKARWIADKDTVTIPDFDEPRRLEASHFDMVKVASAQDVHFIQIVRVLSGWARTLDEGREDTAQRD